MEGAIKQPRETGDNVEEPEVDVAGNEVRSDGENLRSDGNKSGSEGGGSDMLRNGARNRNDAVCSGGESVNANDMNGETIDSGCISEVPTADKSAMEKQTDINVELNKEEADIGGVKEGTLTETSIEDGCDAKKMEGRCSNDSAEVMRGVSGGEDRECTEDVAMEEGTGKSDPTDSIQISTGNGPPKTLSQNAVLDEVPLDENEEMEDAANTNPVKAAKGELQGQVKVLRASGGNIHKIKPAPKLDSDDPPLPDQQQAASPNSLVRYSPSAAENYSDQPMRTTHTHETLPALPEDDDGTPEEQAAFMNEVESYYRQKGMDFKAPRFYQQPLNCLKLWRAVIRLGGYERVTGCKLWRQVGESFRPPKTCTTVSWTFRIFFEKALLEYEKYQIQIGALHYPAAPLPEAPPLEKEGNGHHGSEPGRARRDAAARAMQGWHSQRHSGNGEIGEPVTKSKNINSMSKREKNLKSIGPLKQKRPNDLETSNKVARTEIPDHLVASVVDIGPPADWVKINVRQTIDCFEVYALVPGLIREEVRVQSDPAGRLVITGQPEQLDNPWGITPFKKVVTLPARIDPLHTSAVVSLHGGLFVRVPFEQQPAITTS